MNNRNIIIAILSVLILLFAFFTIKNVRDNKARSTEIDFIEQMKEQQSELTQKLQLLEDSLQQLQYGGNNSNRLIVLQKELVNLEQQKIDNNPELDKKITTLKKEINTIEQSSSKLPQLKKDLATFQKQQKQGVKNPELETKIATLKKEINTIEQSSSKLPQLKKDLVTLEKQKPSNNSELETKITIVKKEINTIEQSSSKLPQLKKDLATFEKQQKQGVKNPELEKKIVSLKKEINTIEKSSTKLPQLKKDLTTLEKQKSSNNSDLDKKIESVKREIAMIQKSPKGSSKEQELETEIKRLEVLQAQSKNKTNNSQSQEVEKLKKQIADLSKNSNSTVQSSQDKEEIARLKRQLAEVSSNSKNTTHTTNDDYALQIELLKKQLMDCKKNAGPSSSSGSSQSNISSDKEKTYKQQIADLQKQLSQYTEVLSTRKQESSDNIKMLVQNIEAKGLFIDKKSNVEKETMFAGKMKTFRISFVLVSETPLDGDITLGVRIYDMANEELVKISGINEVQIDKGEDNIVTCSYAQIVSARGQKKVSVQKVFDASCFTELTKNAIYMIEVYTRKGILLGTQKIKISAGEAVTTF